MRKYILVITLASLLLTPLALGAEKAAPAPAPAPAAPPPPPAPGVPQQVSVAVKVVEFQTERGVETGLSAYFQEREKIGRYGRVEQSSSISAADITFPTSSVSGLTVFLDNLRLGDGDVEVVLQALASENRAYILSRPRVKVLVGDPQGSKIETVQNIPYESTAVVGVTTVQTTAFKDVGVSLNVNVPQIIDDDGDWATTDDTYIQLSIDASVREEGASLVIALDDTVTGIFNSLEAISAPEFISRSVKTNVWVRHGQVLVLGGLYRNTKQRSLDSVPWLAQAEDFAVGAAERFVPGNFLGTPVSASLGNRASSDGRRELVFFLRCEAWRPAYTVVDEFDFVGPEYEEKPTPVEVIKGVLEGITEIPQTIGEGVKKEVEGVTEGTPLESELGGQE